ncbi:MAG: hydroxyacylglutathione hydrolase [Steroidobacter sp.]
MSGTNHGTAENSSALSTLKVSAVPAFADNYIWLIHGQRDARQVIAVDPGDADAVMHALTRDGLQLAGMLVTHHHADHTGGVLELLNMFPVPVYGPDSEMIPGNPVKVTEGQLIEFPALELAFTVMDVPGHTAGHVAYLGHGSLFCGDTLFSAGCGRLMGGTAEQLWRSLSRLATLPGTTQVYCTHEYTLENLRFARTVEPDNGLVLARQEQCQRWRSEGRPTLPSDIGTELNINPFLRANQETVIRSAEQHAGQALDSALQVFTELRTWKNQF